MSAKSTTSTGLEADWEKDDGPRLTREIAERARHAVGEHVIREAKPRGRPRKAAGERKEAISLRLSPEVLAHFRSSGEGWQTRIDEVLREHVRAQFVGGGAIISHSCLTMVSADNLRAQTDPSEGFLGSVYMHCTPFDLNESKDFADRAETVATEVAELSKRSGVTMTFGKDARAGRLVGPGARRKGLKDLANK